MIANSFKGWLKVRNSGISSLVPVGEGVGVGEGDGEGVGVGEGDGEGVGVACFGCEAVLLSFLSAQDSFLPCFTQIKTFLPTVLAIPFVEHLSPAFTAAVEYGMEEDMIPIRTRTIRRFFATIKLSDEILS